MLKSLFAALAVTTALGFPAAAMAKPVTFTTTLKDYGGNGAYLAFYVTDKSGAYAGSLWMAGGKSKYYKHLANWYQATGGDRAQINGITGSTTFQWSINIIFCFICVVTNICFGRFF